jgi:hypothetical protein
MKAKCPSCNKVVELQDETKVQELVTCPFCKTILELVKKFPPTLDWVEDVTIGSSQKLIKKFY